MKSSLRHAAALAAVGVLAFAAAGSAMAHGRGHFGVFIGAPVYPWYWGGPVYSYPYAYPAPVVREYVYETTPPASTPLEAPDQKWYYCREKAGYYPYVQECPSAWESVPAKPPAASK